MLRALVAAACVPVRLTCDVSYDFGDQDTVVATQMEVTLTWWQVAPANKANVYLSTATGTACNSGYFGAQFHSDGTTTLLFSMWDSPKYLPNKEFVYQSLPGSPNCHRNALDSSGNSTGTQCAPHLNGTEVKLEFGVPYVFTFGIVAQNTSGAMWEVSMLDPKHDFTISVGKIFFVDEPMGLPQTCRTLGKRQRPPTSGLSSYTFMEYFESPRDYLSAASWSDMKITGPWWSTGAFTKAPLFYAKLGNGGCNAHPRPASTHHSGIASDAECRQLCTDNATCGAYDFCSGANCAGSCNIWPHDAAYAGVFGYPTVECYVKQALVRPRGITGECCEHSDGTDYVNGSSSTCVPPECDSPDIHFMNGPNLKIPEKVLAEHPTCLGPSPVQSSGIANVGHSCWDVRIPDSLDDCHQGLPTRPSGTLVV